MPRVKLRVNYWLSEDFQDASNGVKEMSMLVPEAESIFEMICRLAEKDDIFRKAVFDEKNQMIQTNVVVILNGRIVNPYERSEATLKEGDEVTLLPMMYGG